MDGKVQSGFAWPLAAIREFPRGSQFGGFLLCAAFTSPPPYFTPLTGMLVFSGAAQDMPPFGVSAHLVGGLWGGDGGGAAVDQGGQLVEADDAEEVA